MHVETEKVIWAALSGAVHILRTDHLGSINTSTSIKLSRTCRDMFVKLAKDCQREMNCEDELLYGHFDNVKDWETEKALEDLVPDGGCPVCEDGYIYDYDGMSLVCDYCDTSMEDSDEIDSEDEFHTVEQQHTGSLALSIINRDYPEHSIAMVDRIRNFVSSGEKARDLAEAGSSMTVDTLNNYYLSKWPKWDDSSQCYRDEDDGEVGC